MQTATFKDNRCVIGNDVKLIVIPSRVTVEFGKTIDPASIFVIQIWRDGQLLNEQPVNAKAAFSSLVPRDVDIRECGVRVCLPNGIVLAELDVEEDLYPFMRPRKEQSHITENYVSVPPALTITDERGDVWSLNVAAPFAPRQKSPDGEFALPVMRNGENAHEIGSRIERRGGKIRIFTANGWKTWNGRSFF